jgi:RNase H-like domain found in reverse transcriptase
MLKEMICASSVLIYVDVNKRVQMKTDASNYVYGAILSQKADSSRQHLFEVHVPSRTELQDTGQGDTPQCSGTSALVPLARTHL